jgi:hypothetical protein
MTISKLAKGLVFLAVTVTSCQPQYGSVPINAPKGIGQLEIEARFTTVVWGEVWNHHLALEIQAEEALKRVITESARCVYRDGPDANKVSNAEMTLRRFVTSVAQNAERTRSLTVSASLIDAIKSRVCPVYPICRIPTHDQLDSSTPAGSRGPRYVRL